MNGIDVVQPVLAVGVAAVVGVAALMVVLAYFVIGVNQSFNNERTSVYDNVVPLRGCAPGMVMRVQQVSSSIAKMRSVVLVEDEMHAGHCGATN